MSIDQIVSELDLEITRLEKAKQILAGKQEKSSLFVVSTNKHMVGAREHRNRSVAQRKRWERARKEKQAA